MHISRYQEKSIEELQSLLPYLETVYEITDNNNKLVISQEMKMIKKLIKEKENDCMGIV